MDRRDAPGDCVNKKKRSPGKWIFIPALGGALIFGSVGLQDFMERWESGSKRVLVVYADKLAQGLPTVCNGLTRHVTATPIIVGERWSEEMCEREEQVARTTLQLHLIRCFDRMPPQSVFDMASDHAWNNGVAGTCGSAAMKAWNRGEWALGCRRMVFSDGGRRVWAYRKTGRKLANGKPEYAYVKGLANRGDGRLAICRQLSAYDPGEATR